MGDFDRLTPSTAMRHHDLGISSFPQGESTNSFGKSRVIQVIRLLGVIICVPQQYFLTGMLMDSLLDPTASHSANLEYSASTNH
jgi:hypothetical protein